jgi:hypothetical protein
VLRLNDLGKRSDFVREFRHLFPHIGVNDGTLRAWVKDFVASRSARPDVKSVKYRRKSASRRIGSFSDLRRHCGEPLDYILDESPCISHRDLAAALRECNVEVTAEQRCLSDYLALWSAGMSWDEGNMTWSGFCWLL